MYKFVSGILHVQVNSHWRPFFYVNSEGDGLEDFLAAVFRFGRVYVRIFISAAGHCRIRVETTTAAVSTEEFQGIDILLAGFPGLVAFRRTDCDSREAYLPAVVGKIRVSLSPLTLEMRHSTEM